MAARLTDLLTDHATIPRQASTANPINPSRAPTAMNTVPSGVFVVCMYGAFAVGGTVTMGAAVVVEDEVEDEEVVVVETDVVDVLSLVDVVLSEDVDEDDVVVSILVVFSDLVEEEEDEEEVLVVLSDEEDEVDSAVVAAVVSVTLGVLSLVERSSVVWAASAVVSDFVSPALWADT